MATVETARMTAEEFWEWCGRPENQGKRALRSIDFVQQEGENGLHRSRLGRLEQMARLFAETGADRAEGGR